MSDQPFSKWGLELESLPHYQPHETYSQQPSSPTSPTFPAMPTVSLATAIKLIDCMTQTVWSLSQFGLGSLECSRSAWAAMCSFTNLASQTRDILLQKHRRGSTANEPLDQRSANLWNATTHLDVLIARFAVQSRHLSNWEEVAAELQRSFPKWGQVYSQQIAWVALNPLEATTPPPPT